MNNKLKDLLLEFLPLTIVEPILHRAEELSLVMKIKKEKGSWHREMLRELIRKYSNKCMSCGFAGSETNKLTLDHIIPKKVLLDMGLSKYFKDKRNLQILCTKCNHKKSSSFDWTNPKTIVLIKYYVSLYEKQKQR